MLLFPICWPYPAKLWSLSHSFSSRSHSADFLQVRVDAKQLRKNKAADKQLIADRLLRTKGRATADQPSSVSIEQMQAVR